MTWRFGSDHVKDADVHVTPDSSTPDGGFGARTKSKHVKQNVVISTNTIHKRQIPEISIF